MSESSANEASRSGSTGAGRRVLVTGAGGGIGEAVCRRLARGGARLWLVGRREPPLRGTAEACGTEAGETIVDPLDAADEEQVAALAGRLAEEWGALDAMVSCAGQTHFATVERTALEDWNQLLRANLTGPFLMLKHLLPLLRRGRSPAVVHVASTLGLVGLAGAPAYCASKAGLVNFTRAAALELARDGVRINAVCPAVVDTGMLDTDRGDGATGRQRRERLGAQHPIGRIARPAEIAAAVVGAIDPEASFTTGAAITVDGGMLAGFLD